MTSVQDAYSDAVQTDDQQSDISLTYTATTDTSVVELLSETLRGDGEIAEITLEDIIDASEKSVDDVVDYVVSNPDQLMLCAQFAAEDCDYREARLVDPVNPTRIEDIRTEHIGSLVSIECRVTDRSDQRPRVRIAEFTCNQCGSTTSQHQSLSDDGEIEYPSQHPCEHHRKKDWDYDQARSKMLDSQQAIVQDLHTNSDSANPMDIRLNLYEGLVNEVETGDTVRINGIVRAVDDGEKSSEHYIQPVGVQKTQESFERVGLDDEDIEEIEDLADSEHIFSRLESSIAPSVVNTGSHDLARRAILLQLVGGVDHSTAGNKHRSDIHIALVGDPSVAKSDLAKFANKVAPKSVYQSADNVSKVGLTAAVTREDRFDKSEWTVSGGPLVMADGGLCVIDELDKAPDDIQGALQEPLSEQTVTVSKADIKNVTLPAGCSVLAVANPKNERFNKFDVLPKQIDINPAIWSRMDVIVPFLDRADEDTDMAIAGSILDRAQGNHTEVIDPDTIRKYVAHARTYEPELTDDVASFLQSEYARLRQRSHGDTIAVDTRKMDALVRMSEASARLRLSETVDIEDAERAVSLLEGWLGKLIGDEDGQWNIDRISSGNTTQREKENLMWETLNNLADESEDGRVERDTLVSELADLLDGETTNDIQDIINKFVGKQDLDQTDGKLLDAR